MANSTIIPSFGAQELPAETTQAEIEANRFTEAALQRHKREGMELAVRARWAALAVLAVLLPLLNPRWEVLYYIFMLGLLGLVGLLQQRVARVGVSRMELAILFLDLTLTTFILVFPNPFSTIELPTAGIYAFDTFNYFFVVLAAGSMAYSWRTIMAMGLWGGGLWLLAALAVMWYGVKDPNLTQAVQAVFGFDPALARLMDPNNVNLDMRIQEVVIFGIVAVTLAFSVRRFNRLLLSNASLERERENLSRYFSPNVVEELSQHDEPLKQVLSHDVAVLFVDIVGFTAYAADRDPAEVIETLREFHARMETEVFRFEGTLDKYLGDGLMATFGTPLPGEADAANALRCAREMERSVDLWNVARRRKGEPEIKASFGMHHGPVVLADIGTSRLEFAVVGNTVNIASRIEQMTRTLPGCVALSGEMRRQVIAQAGENEPALAGLVEHPGQTIRGIDRKISVWTAC